MLRKVRSGQNEEAKGFKWTCEVFWVVERFLERASEEEALEFENALKTGDIECSATYLNITELADKELFGAMTGRTVNFGKSIRFEVKSAMTADVNGLSWGWGHAPCIVLLYNKG